VNQTEGNLKRNVNRPDKPASFGRSLRIIDGDLVFDQGELALIAGRENFLQAMQVMIETPFGTDIFNANYGFDILNIFLSAQPVNSIKELIRLNIVKSVSQDTRVREIKEVVFEDEARFFEILPGQNADEHRRARKTERRWQAIVVLQTVSEGEVALRLDGIGLRT
jgi:phage baseplate assembly protein W